MRHVEQQQSGAKRFYSMLPFCQILSALILRIILSSCLIALPRHHLHPEFVEFLPDVISVTLALLSFKIFKVFELFKAKAQTGVADILRVILAETGLGSEPYQGSSGQLLKQLQFHKPMRTEKSLCCLMLFAHACNYTYIAFAFPCVLM